MKRTLRIIEHRWALTEPVADARHGWSERKGLLLVVTDGQGHVGLGEAAPLPGYSPDTLDDARVALSELSGRPLPDYDPTEPFVRQIARTSRSIAAPAARFAFESALLDLWSRRRGEPAWKLLVDSKATPAKTLAISALVPSQPSRALSLARSALERGVRCFKVKVGAPGAWTQELDTLRALRRELSGVALRADANQSFSSAELAERLPALRELGLEWLEEPSAALGREPLRVGIALDESLQAVDPAPALLAQLGVVAYVLKPSALGGIARSFELAIRARDAGIDAVVSHVFEGPVSFSAAAALAFGLGPNRPADALDPPPALTSTLRVPGIDVARGRLVAWTEPGLGIALDELLGTLEDARELDA